MGHEFRFPVLLVCYLLTLPTLTTATTTTTTPATPSPPDCPKRCTCSDSNRTVDCSNRGLTRLPPDLSPLVTKLDLSDNLLGPRLNQTFEHMPNLRELDLSGNRFLRLLLCSFSGLLQLRVVDLHGNQLRSLPSDLLADCPRLQVLDLSHNHLDTLPDHLLQHATALKVLNVSHNEAPYLLLGRGFVPLTHLRVLDLSHNPFTNVTEEAFRATQAWDPLVPRALDLSGCQLQDLHQAAFNRIPGLTRLSLAGNPLLSFSTVVDVLKELDDSSLRAVDLSNMSIADPMLFSEVRLLVLKELDLSQNVIESVPAATFGNVRSLQRLDMSGNLLTSLGEGFSDLVNLNVLNISHCRLASFTGPQVRTGLQNLTVLDLSHNRLLEADEVDLSPLRKLRALDLSYNTLRQVVLPGDSSHLQTLSFASNAITSLPSMANMNSLRYFDAHDNNVQRLNGFLFTEAAHVRTVNLSHNDLGAIHHSAFMRVSPEVVDLSHNVLTSTSFLSWINTKEVYMQHNLLYHLDQQTFYGMDRLQVLDLSHNNLSHIHPDTFKFLGNLTYLSLANNSLHGRGELLGELMRVMLRLEDVDLSHNQLEAINATSFKPMTLLRSVSLARNRLSVVPAQLFQDKEHLAQIDVSGNPFHCACDLLPLQDWLRGPAFTARVKVRERYDLNQTNTCVTPEEHRGTPVVDYEVGRFQCDTKLLYLIIFGSVGGAIILAGVVGSLACHAHSKWKRNRAAPPADKDRYRLLLHGGGGEKAGGGRPPSRKAKRDNADPRKDNNAKRVDLVRVSKHGDPLGKQELVNGWVASKHLTVASKNYDQHRYRDKTQQAPPRPPWPQRLVGRGKPDERERAGRRDQQPPFAPDDAYFVREGQRIRNVSEMMPLRPPRQSSRPRPAQVPVWDDRYYRPKYQPYVVNLGRRGAPDRWERVAEPPYPLPWRAGGAREEALYRREGGRYHTLPYPAPWPRQAPYGPDYPYRGRMVDAEGEEQYGRGRQGRALPYAGDRRPPREYPADPSDFPDPPRQREYENIRDYHREQGRPDPRDERPPNQPPDPRPDPAHAGRQDSAYPRESPAHPRESPAHDGEGRQDRRAGEEQGGENGRPIKRGTSDAQIHTRDSEYRNAMDNPVPPAKAASTTNLAEDKTSDWL